MMAMQASIAMGEIGVQMSDVDTPALDILNEILNSFGGRLFNEIRSKEVSKSLICVLLKVKTSA